MRAVPVAGVVAHHRRRIVHDHRRERPASTALPFLTYRTAVEARQGVVELLTRPHHLADVLDGKRRLQIREDRAAHVLGRFPDDEEVFHN